MFEIPMTPSRFIKQFERQLGHRSQRILDIGCHVGRNSLYLARLGHDVTAVDTVPTALQNGNDFAKAKDITNCRFVAADGRRLPFRTETFSVVIANEILHRMSRSDAIRLLWSAQDATKPEGLHGISGYFVGDEQIESNKGHYLANNELAQIYEDAGWHVQDYYEDKPRIEEIGDSLYVRSLATIIARKPNQ